MALVGGQRNSLKRAVDHNLLIGQALAKANEVQVHWRLSNEVLTMDRFKRDHETALDWIPKAFEIDCFFEQLPYLRQRP